jgi:hypothetical protein
VVNSGGGTARGKRATARVARSTEVPPHQIDEIGGSSMRRAARQSAWLRDRRYVSDAGCKGRRSDL